jgi:hypothetical protein
VRQLTKSALARALTTTAILGALLIAAGAPIYATG